jgi:hypothetical protein
MITQPDVKRVGLYQLRVIGVNLDIAPGDTVQKLPVHENHGIPMGTERSLGL